MLEFEDHVRVFRLGMVGDFFRRGDFGSLDVGLDERVDDRFGLYCRGVLLDAVVDTVTFLVHLGLAPVFPELVDLEDVSDAFERDLSDRHVPVRRLINSVRREEVRVTLRLASPLQALPRVGYKGDLVALEVDG